MAKWVWIVIRYIKYVCFVYVYMCLFVALRVCEPERGGTAAQLLKEDITL